MSPAALRENAEGAAALAASLQAWAIADTTERGDKLLLRNSAMWAADLSNALAELAERMQK